MKKLVQTGKVIVLIGLFILFKQVNTFNGIGGYVDNSWLILITSLFFISIGGIIVMASKKDV